VVAVVARLLNQAARALAAWSGWTYSATALRGRRWRGGLLLRDKETGLVLGLTRKSVAGNHPTRVIVLGMLAAAALHGSATTSAARVGLDEQLLEIRVNGKIITEFDSVMEASESRFYVTAESLRAARLRVPPVSPVRIADRDYFPLAAIPGVIVKMNRERQLLEIQAPPEAFTGSSLDGLDLKIQKPQLSEPGLFLNHDFQYFRGAGSSAFSGMVEGGFFSRLGVLTSRFANAQLDRRNMILRLDTQFIRDFPEHRATLTIGDAISGGNPWARQVYFAGVRYASKFSTQPGFIPFALPSLTGLAVQPSVVDVYVDNVKTLSRRVDTGPFSISNVPIMSSQGQVQMVVTDVMGRQQIVSQQYIATSQLLRKGVSEYAYEAGMPRRNMGRTNYGYASFFAEGTHRYGITDDFTIEGRGEFALDSRTAGVGATYALRPIGIVGGGMAGSYADGRTGTLIYADFSRPARAMAFSAHYQASSAGFRQVGLDRLQKAPGQILQVNISRPLGNRATVGIGYLQRDGRTEPSLRGPLASLGLRLGRAYLSVGGTYSLMQGRQYGITMALMVPLGERTMAMATGDVRNNGGQANYEVQRSLPVGPGYGYRVRTSTFDRNQIDAGFSYQNNTGTYTVEASQGGGQTSARIYEQGALVFLRGHLMRARWLNDSFAVVEVPGQKDAEVFVNNQSIGRTNRHGLALASWMVPYSPNVVRVDDENVPLDSTMDLGERTLAPYPRSGYFVEFAAKRIDGASIILRTPGGEPVPLGALVTVNGKREEYMVARRGEVFVTAMEYPAVLSAQWDGGRCTAKVPGAAPKEPLPRIGPLVCRGGLK
jgi:outer membrane usher protein